MLKLEEQFIWDQVDNEGGLDPLDQSVELIWDYLETEYEYESKNLRLDYVAEGLTLTDVYEWVTAIFTAALVNHQLTYQALCGMLQHRIKSPHLSVSAKVLTVAEMAALCSKTGLIQIIKQGPGKSILIEPGFNLDVEIPVRDKHPLIFQEPEPVTNNQGLILGNPQNQHDKEICLDHINRMNRIPLSLNERFIFTYVETPKKPLDTLQKKEQWDKHVEDSYEKYAEFIVNGNKGFLKYAYDTRGRVYDTGYHITSQGTGYKKAILELANKELIKGD